MNCRNVLQAGAAVVLLAGLGRVANAQGVYPDKPVRVTVSYGPGGAIDVVARILAEHMTNTLGKPVLVDNKPGAGSTIAADAIARSAPDGYSLLVTGMAHSVIAELFPQVTFDPVQLLPADQPSRRHAVRARGASLGARHRLRELHRLHEGQAQRHQLRLRRRREARPISARCCWRKRSGIEFVRVPYRSTPAAMNDLVAGRVGFMMDFAERAGPAREERRVAGIRCDVAGALASAVRMCRRSTSSA